MASFYHWCDKARSFIHRAAHRLGEDNEFAPGSLAQQAKAQNSLRLELPSFTTLLPYETLDDDKIFINRKTIGCGFVFSPLAGANETLMKSLAELFKNKLSQDTDCTLWLYKHSYLAKRLQDNIESIVAQGGLYAKLARLSLDYHIHAIHQGYANARHVPAQLMDYSGYLFLSRPKQVGGILALQTIRDEFESELKVAGFALRRLEKNEFIALLQTVVSPMPHDIHWPVVIDDPCVIRESIARPGSVYKIDDEAIDISVLDEKGEAQTTRLLCCELSHYSKEPFALWQAPDLFANLLHPEQGIACPFLISMTIRGVNQEQVRAAVKRRAKSLSANDNAIQNFIYPGLHDEAKEWRAVHQETARGSVALMPTVYHLLLFTPPEKAREHLATAT